MKGEINVCIVPLRTEGGACRTVAFFLAGRGFACSTAGPEDVSLHDVMRADTLLLILSHKTPLPPQLLNVVDAASSRGKNVAVVSTDSADLDPALAYYVTQNNVLSIDSLHRLPDVLLGDEPAPLRRRLDAALWTARACGAAAAAMLVRTGMHFTARTAPFFAVAGFQLLTEGAAYRGLFRAIPKPWGSAAGENRYFRTAPYGESSEDRAAYTRADGAHETALRWLLDAREHLLYLTGTSGCGKTSMLNAYIVPHLRECGRNVVRVPAWEAAARCSIAGERRTVFIIDHFEEFLISAPPRAKATFRRTLEAVRGSDAVLLVVMRDDYIGMLQELELPALAQRQNWLQIGRFTHEASVRFLKDSRLPLNDGEIERLVESAAEMDEIKGLVRPITLNLVGYVLTRGGQRGSDAVSLIRAHIARAIRSAGRPSQVIPVARQLLTTHATKRSATVERIATRTALPADDVRAILDRFGSEGMVRTAEGPGGLFEFSHDFIASEVARDIDAPNRRVREYGGLAAMLLALCIGVAAFLTYCPRCPTTYVVPTPDAEPWGIATDSRGDVWFTEAVGNKIGLLHAGRISEYPIAGKHAIPHYIVAGPDGSAWFTENGPETSRIGHVLPNGRIVEYALSIPRSMPEGLFRAHDGTLWFTEQRTARFGSITPSGRVREFALPPKSYPNGIAIAADGTLWIADSHRDLIWHASHDGTLLGAYHTPSANSTPRDIAPGPDGTLWFVENQANKIGRISPSGHITEYRLQTGIAHPRGIVFADGAFWFTSDDRVNRMALRGRTTTIYTSTSHGTMPTMIASRRDGSLWFTETDANAIVHIITR